MNFLIILFLQIANQKKLLHNYLKKIKKKVFLPTG